jgi:membrane associated rhomboid family serine protease
VTIPPVSTDNYCYRHPDRQSVVLCQRCGRTICGQCQTPAPVGVHCPECVREARGSAPRVRPQSVTAVRSMVSSGGPVVTYAIIAVTVLIWLAQLFSRGFVTNALFFYAPAALVEPWRIVTALFVHNASLPSGILHIGFNMYSLFIFGSILEQQLGRARFAALYFLSGIGGSLAVALLAPGTAVVGASGAIFGLLGAFFVIQRHLGGQSAQILVLVALNLAIGFIVPGIAWQAHVGGVVVGALVALLLMRTRHRSKTPLQAAGLVGGAVVLVAAILLRSASLLGVV